jgi:hypothetical protein
MYAWLLNNEIVTNFQTFSPFIKRPMKKKQQMQMPSTDSYPVKKIIFNYLLIHNFYQTNRKVLKIW